MRTVSSTVASVSCFLMPLIGALGACGSDSAGAPDTPDAVDPADTTPPVDTRVPETTPIAACGNGVLEPPEKCDDGELNGTYDHCAVGCNGVGLRCGNGYVEVAFELCDDGAALNGTYGHCATDCQGLGNGCGDGIVTPPAESCDDGPRNGQEGACAADCSPTPGCGDGVLAAPEACDDGPLNGFYDHCANDCAGPGPHCGDANKDKGEACDDGEDNGSYGACAADCNSLGSRCGDHLVDPAHEACDDGGDNGLNGHCNDTCTGQTNGWIEQPTDLPNRGLDGTTCSEDDLFGKYLHYRMRFRGNHTAAYPGFVVAGRDHGMGMPASRREPNVNCPGYWGFAACGRPDYPDAKGLYKWGDGTSWLGEYMATLALEHAMFKKLGLPTAETEADLMDALAALDRLDDFAESYFPPAPPNRDGLFLRDDVPRGFEKDAEGHYRWPRDDGQNGYECIAADTACEAPTIESGSFTSQDQTITLLYGLALINTLVPHDLVVNGIAVAADAREKVHRLVWYLRKNGWKVKDPNGGSPPDQWGGNAIGFSNGMAKVANAVVGDEFGVTDYRNFASRTLGEASWAGLQVIWEATHAYNRTLALHLAAANGTWGATKMPKMALSDDKDAAAMGWSLLQGKRLGAPFSEWRVDALLHSAPCGGPCRGKSCPAEVLGWMGESRATNPEDRLGSRHNEGDFNGLDYMELFAAYFLYRNGRIGPPPPTGHPDCQGFVGLDAILASGASDGQIYNPGGACAQVLDLSRNFCGRSFGAWLDDATQGKVSIYAGKGRWSCTPGGSCSITRSNAENTSGDDLILGTTGDDDLSGGDGNDCLVGFGGNDTLKGNQGYDTLDGGDGDDDLYGENSGIVLDGEGDRLLGGSGNDHLKGGPGKDELTGGDGDDELIGDSGDDYLLGGDGNDHLEGQGGEDSLVGGAGDDSLEGGDAGDNLWGGPGRDRLDGSLGDDALNGEGGDDFLRGGMGNDTLSSGDDWDAQQFGHDRLCGNGGDDTIWGGWDGDECLGGGWLLGGTDAVQGCDDGTASEGDCDNGAFNSW